MNELGKMIFAIQGIEIYNFYNMMEQGDKIWQN
jgi:hypothetical protein